MSLGVYVINQQSLGALSIKLKIFNDTCDEA